MDKYSFNRRKIYSNFDRKNKWLGLIDYKTLWIVGIYLCVVVFILSKIDIRLMYKIYIFAIFSLPVCAMFVCSDIKQDSIFDMFVTIVGFLIKKSIYTKENSNVNLIKNEIYKI